MWARYAEIALLQVPNRGCYRAFAPRGDDFSGELTLGDLFHAAGLASGIASCRRLLRIWLNFLITTGRRARFITTHENQGEVLAERTEDRRYFDLRPTPVFAALADRLVIEWTKDAVNWAKTGDQATSMTVVEISDPSSVPFPGFDSLLVSFEELQAVITDDRYGQ